MRAVGWLPLLVVVDATLGATAVGHPSLDPQQRELITRYEVVLQSKKIAPGLQRHRAMGLFDAPAGDVFRVATSYERYSEYIPRISASYTVWQGTQEAVVVFEADMPWPLVDAWVHVRVQHDHPRRGSYRMRFAMVRGSVHRCEGSLLVEPFGDGRSLVTYELLALPDSLLPHPWVQGIMGRAAVLFVHFLRSRVNRLQQQGLLRSPAALEPSPTVAGNEELYDD
ncbi:MAG: SRPBCC family protein [Myxococcales bacterium]|nr:hypothetical protein [Myxococcota bacterium]MDW8283632.1 SRPBCC family protein [Myxococcales bacterium]